jgi:hypothetical protein
MKTRLIVGIGSMVLTLGVMLPVLFFLTRGSVSSSVYLLIVASVLFLVLWTIGYMTLLDPLLRRAVGALFNVTIRWSGPSSSIAWTPAEKTGCLAGLSIGLLGYLFLFLWIAPFVATVGVVFWFRS